MKKLALAVLAALATLVGYAQGEKGDITLDLGVGIGASGTATESLTVGSHAMFTQRIGAEWVVLPKMINGKFELAAGVYINNAYGTRSEDEHGSFDYKYYFSYSLNDWSHSSNRRQIRREGDGTATRESERDDINLLPTVSFRYYVTPKFQVYASVGVGVGVVNTFDVSHDAIEGFESRSEYGNPTYSYNDLAHAQWDMESGTRVCAAIAGYVGLRYYLTDNFGINAQVGDIASNLYSRWGSSNAFLSVGVSLNI